MCIISLRHVTYKIGRNNKSRFAKILIHWGIFILGVSSAPQSEMFSPCHANETTVKPLLCVSQRCALFSLKARRTGGIEGNGFGVRCADKSLLNFAQSDI